MLTNAPSFFQALVSFFQQHFQGQNIQGIEGVQEHLGEGSICLKKECLTQTLEMLRTHPPFLFDQLMDVCGVDHLERCPRFDAVYHLLSIPHNQRLRLKVRVDEGEPIPSVCHIYPSAGWFEREMFDLFGISFSNHPDLRRILTDYNFEGHPLRKDFPLVGHVEQRYDLEAKKVVYEPVNLPQAMRNFDFESPWEGMDTAFHQLQKNPLDSTSSLRPSCQKEAPTKVSS